MVQNAKPLLSITVGEMMSTPVIRIPDAMSLQGAARILAQADVSGAPVVNDMGTCVGVLSATDFLNWMNSHRAQRGITVSPAYCASWQVVESEAQADDLVRDYMTHDIVMVPPTATIGEVARIMIDAHIHRVIVADRHNEPLGIVTSTDVLAAIARNDQSQARPDSASHATPRFIARATALAGSL